MNNRFNGEYIIFSAHALSYIPIRGYQLAEVEQAIREMEWQPTEHNRLDVRKNFPYQAIWNGKFYETKQVRPIFVVENGTITVITVYTYFF